MIALALEVLGLGVLLIALALLAGYYTSPGREVPDRTAMIAETSECVNPRRLEKGAYGLVGSPITMTIRRADGTIRGQDAETETQERWLHGGPR